MEQRADNATANARYSRQQKPLEKCFKRYVEPFTADTQMIKQFVHNYI
jgi:hypothetical protein